MFRLYALRLPFVIDAAVSVTPSAKQPQITYGNCALPGSGQAESALAAW
jgi:hypothetical protein